MAEIYSFGAWVRRRRKTLDLTQASLAAQVGLAAVTIQKIEADERRPSRQVAELLAQVLAIPADQRETFVSVARAEQAADRLPNVAPSARSGEPPARSLPVRLTSFIGRERELTELTMLLRRPEVRLVTLTGPGGIGKTSLALQAAAALIGEYRDGVWFVDLAPVSNVAQIAGAIAQSLGLPEQVDPLLHTQSAPESRVYAPADQLDRARLVRFLVTRRILLLLDNLEQVADGAADLIVNLLRAATGLTILATSRVTLRLSVEHVFAVAPLDLPAPAAPTARLAWRSNWPLRRAGYSHHRRSWNGSRIMDSCAY